MHPGMEDGLEFILRYDQITQQCINTFTLPCLTECLSECFKCESFIKVLLYPPALWLRLT